MHKSLLVNFVMRVLFFFFLPPLPLRYTAFDSSTEHRKDPCRERSRTPRVHFHPGGGELWRGRAERPLYLVGVAPQAAGLASLAALQRNEME